MKRARINHDLVKEFSKEHVEKLQNELAELKLKNKLSNERNWVLRLDHWYLRQVPSGSKWGPKQEARLMTKGEASIIFWEYSPSVTVESLRLEQLAEYSPFERNDPRNRFSDGDMANLRGPHVSSADVISAIEADANVMHDAGRTVYQCMVNGQISSTEQRINGDTWLRSTIITLPDPEEIDEGGPIDRQFSRLDSVMNGIKQSIRDALNEAVSSPKKDKDNE